MNITMEVKYGVDERSNTNFGAFSSLSSLSKLVYPVEGKRNCVFRRLLATLQPVMLVGRSVAMSFFSVFGVFGRLLHYCSCQNA